MQELLNAIPNVDTLLALEPKELGAWELGGRLSFIQAI
jgi:hypothetical protein